MHGGGTGPRGSPGSRGFTPGRGRSLGTSGGRLASAASGVDSDAWEGEVDDLLAWTEQLNDTAESPGAAGGVVGGGGEMMQEGYP